MTLLDGGCPAATPTRPRHATAHAHRRV